MNNEQCRTFGMTKYATKCNINTCSSFTAAFSMWIVLKYSNRQ